MANDRNSAPGKPLVAVLGALALAALLAWWLAAFVCCRHAGLV